MLIITNKALIFDDQGIFRDKLTVSNRKKLFDYQGGKYNIDLSKGSCYRHTVIPFLYTIRYYFYTISSSNPLILDKKCEPIISPEAYNLFLETKVIRDMNDLYKSDFSKYLTPTNFIIVAVLIVVIVYFATGHDLSSITGTAQ